MAARGARAIAVPISEQQWVAPAGARRAKAAAGSRLVARVAPPGFKR